MCCLIVLNFQGLFQEFNPSKCLVYVSLLAFVVLFGLRIDRFLLWSYFVVFIPLWIWKMCVLTGAATGTAVWIKHPEYRREDSVDMQAMFIATSFHILLLIFELMVSTNLEFKFMPFRVVFIPIYGLSLLSVVACVWGYKNERRLELETFFSLNVLQFICLSLKWDHVIDWSWVAVFIPVWIIVTILSLWVLYYTIWALLCAGSTEIAMSRRRERLTTAVTSCCIVIPLLVFLVLLIRRFDGLSTAYYSIIFIPLEITLVTLIVTTCCQKGSNQWWFGMRKDFCEFLLDLFPWLREYGNVSYSLPDPNAPNDANNDDNNNNTSLDIRLDKEKRKDIPKIVGTVLVIDMPD